jgi:arylsulfatase A-like enzyme
VTRFRRIAVLALASVLSLAACRAREEASAPLPWQRIDLWQVKPEVELVPGDNKWLRPAVQVIGYLGAEEVRDMSRVPPQQLVAFPKRTAGQIRVIEQIASSRLKWRMRIGQDAYFSFIPLGTQKGCACRYLFGVRDAGVIKELYRVEVPAVGPLAAATVEVDLSPYIGHEVDLLFQIDAPAELLVPVPGHPFPTALVGSPALYQRHPLPPAPPSTAAPSDRPNILLIGVDTLRADHVGAWGREPSLTPAMDQLAGQSDVWLDAYSAFNVTNPSFASIFTGLYGKNHGVYDLQTPLPPSHTTLAEHLRGAGYETLAIISAAHLGDHNSGLGQGFQDVTRATEHFAGELAVDMTLDWIATRNGKHPYFVWLHLFDPHTPHTPPQPFALGFRPANASGLDPIRAWVPFRQPGPRSFDEPVLGGNRDLYDGEVAYLDRQIGRLLGFLESRGALENTLVALVADHGESLGEHGVLYRHVGLYDTTTHVPLMIRWPGRERTGRRIEGLVQTIDLFPTLLKAAKLPVPPQDGVDLGELTADGKHGRRAVFAEHSGKLGLMVRTPDFKYILSQGNTRFFPDGASFYGLKADPGETRNLAGQGLPAEQQLADLLRRWLADRRNSPGTKPREQSDEEKARLKALGYV